MKYKVITDNLDWFGYKRGDIIDHNYMKECINVHPDWFQRIDFSLVTEDGAMIIDPLTVVHWVKSPTSWGSCPAGAVREGKVFSSPKKAKEYRNLISPRSVNYTKEDVISFGEYIKQVIINNEFEQWKSLNFKTR